MKPLFFTILITLITLPTIAQKAEGNGKLSGTIIESGTRTPIEFATVVLIDMGTGNTVDGTVADNKGKFSLNKIPDGRYKISISFIGFDKFEREVEITPSRSNIDLGTITLGFSETELGEVTVEGRRALIEERVDRTIYNAENDDTARGGDATDVLQRVPLVSVDFEGNVSLRGSSNIMVLINNKPSTIMAGSVADALRQIPAEEIKSVEVITSPSAKYDAEGSAGIINIITKKNTLEGATLSINSSAGYRGSNLGLNGSLRRGKLGLSLGGWGRAGYNVEGAFSNNQTTISPLGDELRNTQSTDTRNNNLFGNYNFGFDYDFNEKNSLLGGVRFGARNGRSWQDGLLTQTFLNDQIVNRSLREVNTVDNSGTVDVNLTYTKLFDKPQQELSILTLFSRNNRNNDFINRLMDEDDASVINRQKNENESFNQEITVQIDYQTPIGNKQMIETGVKQIIRNVESDFQFLLGQGAEGPFMPLGDETLSNVLNYNQDVSAAYFSYTYNTMKAYSFKAGARYEYTTINANFQGDETIEVPNYGVLVPSINISRKLENGNTLKAAYNRRIQRPSIMFLNPNLQASNPLNVTIGNPTLDPEFTNNYELGYSMFIKNTSLTLSAFARNTNNAIQSVRDVLGQDTVRTTFRNIGSEDAYGLSAFASINVGKLLLSGGTDFYYARLSNNDPNPEFDAFNDGFVISGRLFGSYDLGKDWAFQLFSFFRGNQIQLQGFRGGFGIYSLSLNKRFANKRGSIGVGAENFIYTPFRINSGLKTPTISQNTTIELYNMNFKVNFSYRIGKMNFDQRPRRRKSINNDDLKSGGSFGGMDGGQAEMSQQGGVGGMPAMAAGGGKAAPIGPKEGAEDAPLAEIAGIWDFTVEGGGPGATGGEIRFDSSEGAYTGTIKSQLMGSTLDLANIKVVGNYLYFTYTVNFGGNEVVISVEATVEGAAFTGNMNIGTFRTLPIKAVLRVE